MIRRFLFTLLLLTGCAFAQVRTGAWVVGGTGRKPPSCTPGPPGYACTILSNRTVLPPHGTSAVGTLDPTKPYVFQKSDPVNTVRYDTTLNTYGTDCQVMIGDASTFGGEPNGNGTYTGGSGTQQASLNLTYITVTAGGAAKLIKLNPAFSGDAKCPLRVVYPVPGSTAPDHVVNQTVFSAVTDNVFFEQGPAGTPSTSVVQGTIATAGTDQTAYTTSTIFDYSRCPHSPGVGLTPAMQTGWASGGADAYFGVGFGWTQYGDNLNVDGTACSGQNCAHTVYVFKKATHQCAALSFPQTSLGTTINLYDWCDPDANGHGSDHANCMSAIPVLTTTPSPACVPMPKSSGLHGIDMSPLGDTVGPGIVCSPSGSDKIFWNYGTGLHVSTNVFTCSNQSTGVNCNGHGKMGEFSTLNAANPSTDITAYPAPTGRNGLWPLGSVRLQGPWAGLIRCEQHYSWQNTPGDDTWDSILTSSVCDQSTYGLTLNNPYFNEYVGIDPVHAAGAVPRFGHNWSTGQPSSPAANQCVSFGCMYGQHFVSQDGNWLFGFTSALGNFGLYANGTQKERFIAVHLQ